MPCFFKKIGWQSLLHGKMNLNVEKVVIVTVVIETVVIVTVLIQHWQSRLIQKDRCWI